MIKSRDYYQKLLDDTPSIIWKTDREGKNDYFNKTWLEFTGLDLSQALEQGWLYSLHPEDVDKCSKLFNDAIVNRKSFEIEHRRRYKQAGQYRWCITSGKPYFGIQGEFAGFIGVVYEITDRKLAEESSRKYHVLLEKARNIILFMDMEGNILEANQAAVRAYGHTREELLALKIFDFNEQAGLDLEQMKQVGEQGILYEIRHIRKDGSTFPVEVSSYSTHIEDQRVSVSIIRDITERKHAERSLMDSEMRYRSLFEVAQDGIFLQEIQEGEPLTTKFIDANAAACQRLGYTKEELLALSPSYFSKEKEVFSSERIREILTKGQATFENVHVTKDGRKIPMEVNRQLLEMDGKKCILLFARDISKRKKAK